MCPAGESGDGPGVAAVAGTAKTRTAASMLHATTELHGRRITRGYQFFRGTHTEPDHYSGAGAASKHPGRSGRRNLRSQPLSRSGLRRVGLGTACAPDPGSARIQARRLGPAKPATDGALGPRAERGAG